MEVCRLASKYLPLNKIDINRLFEGKLEINGITRELSGRKVIVISKGFKSYDDAEEICRSFRTLNIYAEPIGLTIQELREERLSDLLT